MSCFQKLVGFAWTPVSRRFAQRRSRWIRLPTRRIYDAGDKKKNAILAGELSDTVKEDLTTRVCDSRRQLLSMCWREADGTTIFENFTPTSAFAETHPEAIRCSDDEMQNRLIMRTRHVGQTLASLPAYGLSLVLGPSFALEVHQFPALWPSRRMVSASCKTQTRPFSSKQSHQAVAVLTVVDLPLVTGHGKVSRSNSLDLHRSFSSSGILPRSSNASIIEPGGRQSSSSKCATDQYRAAAASTRTSPSPPCRS